MEIIKVALADDSDILIRALKQILSGDKSISVTITAVDGKELVDACKLSPPDVAVVDIRMPVMDGIEATQIIKSTLRQTKVLILTTFDDDEYISKLFEAGIDGYLLKGSEEKMLINAIKSVHMGINALDSALMQKISNVFNHQDFKRSELSESELKVAKKIAEGSYNKDIASELGLSYGRVRNVVSEIYRKLGITSREDIKKHM